MVRHPERIGGAAVRGVRRGRGSGGSLVVRGAEAESVARALGAEDIYPSELGSDTGGLEEAYLRLTGVDPLAGGHGDRGWNLRRRT
ncbi:MAG: hypothetical protein R2789_15795 [Microthrixaceae bacterium]